MNPDFRKVALIAASLGLIVSVFFALRPDDDQEAATTATTAQTTVETTEPATTETEPQPTTTEPADDTVTIRIAVPVDRVPEARKYSVRRGRKVELLVRSELADHVHLHGYDLIVDVAPGKEGRIEFTADAPGRFEIELEDRHIAIGELEVRP